MGISTNYISKSMFLFGFIFFLFLNQNIFAQEGAPKLNPEQFDVQSHKKKKNVILDIRTPEETAEGFIEGAEFINFLGEDFEQEVNKLNKNRTYYVYCRSAKRTIPATEKMKALGFKKVYMLEGGLNNWVESGKPLKKAE
jgi:rhodanese-related sulfurtransferase